MITGDNEICLGPRRDVDGVSDPHGCKMTKVNVGGIRDSLVLSDQPYEIANL